MKPVIAFTLVLGAVSIVACGHSSTQEATADCKNLSSSFPSSDTATFNKCVACFENCSDCEVQGTSPTTFKCPGDSSTGGGGGSGTTGSTGTGK